MNLPWISKEASRWLAVDSFISCETSYTYRVLMERKGLKSPLLMVCSLLSYNDSRLRFCRSWKVLTLKQLILLAFSNLKHTQLLLFTQPFVHLYKLIILSLTQKYKTPWRFLFVYLKRAKPLIFFPHLSFTLCLPPPSPALLPQMRLYLFLAMTHKS